MFNLKSRKAKARYQTAFIRMMHRFEITHSKLWFTPLNQTYIKAAKQFKVSGDQDFTKILGEQSVQLAKVLDRTQTQVLSFFGDFAFKEFKKQFKKDALGYATKDMENDFWYEVNAWKQEFGAAKVTGMTQTSKNLLSSTIEAGMKAGKSNAEIAKTLTENSSGINRMRAMRIARTETHSAANMATQAAVKATKLDHERTWVSAMDDRVRGSKLKDRFNHLKVNGQKRGMEEPFDVSGEKLMFPGDPKGSAGNIIHCRCVVVYETKRMVKPVPKPIPPVAKPPRALPKPKPVPKPKPKPVQTQFPAAQFDSPDQKLYVDKIKKGQDEALKSAKRFEDQIGHRASSIGEIEIESAILDQGQYKIFLNTLNKTGQPRIEGAMAMSLDNIDEIAVIEHLGSLGNIKGTGTEFMRRALLQAKRKKYSLTWQSNPEAVDFYKKLGFKMTNKKARVFTVAKNEIDEAIARLGPAGKVIKKKPKLPKAPKDPSRQVGGNIQNPVTRFMSAEHTEEYQKYEDDYVNFFEDLKKRNITPIKHDLWQGVMTKKMLDDTPNVFRQMNGWQNTTQTKGPMALKFKARSIEKGRTSEMIYADISMRSEIIEGAGRLNDSEFLKARAMNQAYMKVNGIKKVKLYRGTDGGVGEELSKEIRKAKQNGKKSFVVDDATLTGYSREKSVAHNFGKDVRGITVTNNFDSEDILVHEDLLWGVTNKQMNEREYICFGRKRGLNISNIDFLDPKGGVKIW